MESGNAIHNDLEADCFGGGSVVCGHASVGDRCDGSLNAAATANNYVGILANVAETFVIADRIGSQIEFIPNLVGANARPTGGRGAFLWGRTGSRVVNSAAAVLLDIPTTA